MTPEEFMTALKAEGIVLTDKKLSQFAAYFDLLVSWNKKMNLTAITDREEVYLKHFYDSLSLSFYTDFSQEFRLVDVGAGAGFPSIPLKIVFPQLKLTIVDSLKKRIGFLEEVIDALGLVNVEAIHDRAETFGQNKAYRGCYDMATARAVANLSVLAEFCLPLVKKGGHFIAMKGAQGEDELQEAKHAIAVLGGKVEAVHAFNLPGEHGERYLIDILKTKETPNKYPRKPGTPNKKPL